MTLVNGRNYGDHDTGLTWWGTGLGYLTDCLSSRGDIGPCETGLRHGRCGLVRSQSKTRGRVLLTRGISC